VGTIAGSWLGAFFAEHYGWRVGFYFFGSAGMVLAVLLYRWLREPQRGAAEGAVADALPPLALREVAGTVFRTPTAILLMAVFMGVNFVAMVFLTWTPTFLVEKFAFKLTAAGLSGSVFIHLASACGSPVGGVLADRLAARIAGGRMLVQLLGLLAGSVFVFLVGTTAHVGTLLASMALFGFCKGLYDSNIFASLYDVIEPRARATAAGIMNTAGWSGGAMGPLAVGWLAGHGRHTSEIQNISEAIAWCSALYLIGVALLLTAIVAFARRDLARWAGSAARKTNLR